MAQQLVLAAIAPNALPRMRIKLGWAALAARHGHLHHQQCNLNQILLLWLVQPQLLNLCQECSHSWILHLNHVLRVKTTTPHLTRQEHALPVGGKLVQRVQSVQRVQRVRNVPLTMMIIATKNSRPATTTPKFLVYPLVFKTQDSLRAGTTSATGIISTKETGDIPIKAFNSPAILCTVLFNKHQRQIEIPAT